MLKLTLSVHNPQNLRTTCSSRSPVAPAVSVVWKDGGKERRTGRPQRSMRNICCSCPLWPWHMDPHEYWIFWSVFQQVFGTSGDFLALIRCGLTAVHVLCNRCTLLMSPGLKQSICGAAASYTQLQRKRMLIKRRQWSRGFPWYWLPPSVLLSLNQTGRFCTVCETLNTSCTMVMLLVQQSVGGLKSDS